MRKMVILLVILMVISVGLLSGCNEISNDDAQFVDKVTTILLDIRGIHLRTITEDYQIVQKHKYSLSDYTLSSKGEKLRDRVRNLFSLIEMVYEDYYGAHLIDDETLETWCEGAETVLLECSQMATELKG